MPRAEAKISTHSAAANQIPGEDARGCMQSIIQSHGIEMGNASLPVLGSPHALDRQGLSFGKRLHDMIALPNHAAANKSAGVRLLPRSGVHRCSVLVEVRKSAGTPREPFAAWQKYGRNPKACSGVHESA